MPLTKQSQITVYVFLAICKLIFRPKFPTQESELIKNSEYNISNLDCYLKLISGKHVLNIHKIILYLCVLKLQSQITKHLFVLYKVPLFWLTQNPATYFFFLYIPGIRQYACSDFTLSDPFLSCLPISLLPAGLYLFTCILSSSMRLHGYILIT